MRKIILIRGISGSGKSTLAKASGLYSHLISGDKALSLMSGPWMGEDDWGIDKASIHEGWKLVHQMLQRRMDRGETIVLEGVMGPEKELVANIEMAHKNRYEVLIVDTNISDIDKSLERQKSRSPELMVRKSSLERQLKFYHKINHEFAIRHNVKFIMSTGLEVKEVANQMRNFISHKIVDLSFYDKIVFIGDLQGCVSPIIEDSSPIKNMELDNNTFYIFTGDLVDRGIENGETMQWAIDKLIPKIKQGKAMLIWGNHEDHLEKWAYGREVTSTEFNKRTAPQLEASNIDKEEVKFLLACMQDAFLIKYQNEIILVTHGGIAGIAPALAEDIAFTVGRIPSSQLTKGISHYSASIDQAFAESSEKIEALTGKKLVQVHGHRNSKMIPISTDNRSFNLEGQAEFGGHIRIATVSKKGWETLELPVKNFINIYDRRQVDAKENRKPYYNQMPIAPWITQGKNVGIISPKDIEAFSKHEHIRVQAMQSKPHISTIAFNKTAFYGQVWDDLTTRARGLFINTNTGEIVSRAYDKFFNLGEREETSQKNVLNYTLPVKARHKYNGFLGIAGYDSETDKLILSSKSMIDGDFAQMFAEITLDRIGQGGIERLRRACRDQKGSAIFEVIDPVRDPHIVEYDSAHIVLLDFVHRSETFSKLNDEDLKKMARYIGVPLAETLWVANNKIALERLIDSATRAESPFDNKKIEGAVLEDAQGRIVKIKTPWYSKWKKARQLGENILLSRRRGKTFSKDIPEELKAYIEWAKELNDYQLDRPIIELRNYFLSETLPPFGKDIEISPKNNKKAEGLKKDWMHLQAKTKLQMIQLAKYMNA